MMLHPKVQELLDSLRALQAHLSRYDEFWAANVQVASDEIARSDAHGLQRFLGYFGGMGSLNDLVLHDAGDPLGSENDQLEALRHRAWELAQNLRGEITMR